jgi:hypothetical protein
MLTFLNALFPDIFPAISELPKSIAWLIIALEFCLCLGAYRRRNDDSV